MAQSLAPWLCKTVSKSILILSFRDFTYLWMLNALNERLYFVWEIFSTWSCVHIILSNRPKLGWFLWYLSTLGVQIMISVKKMNLDCSCLDSIQVQYRNQVLPIFLSTCWRTKLKSSCRDDGILWSRKGKSSNSLSLTPCWSGWIM